MPQVKPPPVRPSRRKEIFYKILGMIIAVIFAIIMLVISELPSHSGFN